MPGKLTIHSDHNPYHTIPKKHVMLNAVTGNRPL